MNTGQLVSQLFAAGLDVLNTTLDGVTKVILAQLGDSVGGTVDSSGAEWWQHVGFASMPSNAVQGQSACQVVALKRSDHDICIASRDTRANAIYGSLKAGESCLYGAGADGKATGRVLCKADGSVTVYTQTGNTSAGHSVAFQVSPTGISAGTPWGAMSLDASGFKLALNGGAGISVDTNGNVSIIGKSVTIQSGSVSLGAMATVASPAVYGLTGITGIASTSVFISP